MNYQAPAPAPGRQRFLKQVGAAAGMALAHDLVAAPKVLGPTTASGSA